MSASKLNDLVTRILRSNPVDGKEQKRILRTLNEVRDSLRWSTEQQPIAEYLDAATLLLSYLSHMGHIGGSEVRSVVARLIETAAKVMTEGPEIVGSAEAAEAAAAASAAVDETFLGLMMEEPAAVEKDRGDKGKKDPVRVISDMLLGEIMVRMGHIQPEQIELALEVQRRTGLKFGESLVKMGAATWEQVQAGLRYQDGCRQVVENFVDTRKEQGQALVPKVESKRGPKPLELAPKPLDVGNNQSYTPAGGKKPLDVASSGPGPSSLRLMSDVLLGEILIERGIITRPQLEKGLATQRATGMRIGEALVHMGAASWDQIELGIRIQGQMRKYMGGGK